ncbi:carboxypeptidase regulatory-like domain-containing protein [Candidatus Dojkabacteria bacterium]|nr:carboxypeptidase regulatory-like domain-containing protein [Candidatus Dojkabacteria bacterium]
MIQKILIILVCILTAFILVYASTIESCFYQTDKQIEINTWIGQSSNTQCNDPENNNLIWSCPDNWSNKEIPKSNDIVVFDSSSLEDSIIDISFQIYGLRILETYTGTVSKYEDKLLKVGSEGITLKGGILKFGETSLTSKEGILNITFGNYIDTLSKEGLVVERVAYTCSQEIFQGITNDTKQAIAKPIETLSDIFQSIQTSTENSYKHGINPIFNIGNLLLIILNLLIFILLFTHRRAYGYIRDKISKEPIKFTPFKILLGASTNISYRGLSDFEGRYSFPVIPGSYRIDIVKEGYKPFSKKINVNQLDIFTNFVEDIELESDGIKKYNLKNSFSFLWEYKIIPKIIYIFPLLLLLGIINLIYIVYGEVNKLYVAISISIYIVYFFVYIFNLIKPRPQLFGIIDTENGLRIPNVLIKIIDFKNNKLIDTKITNHDGFFESAIHKGDYAVFISHPGYEYPSKLYGEGNKRVVISERTLNIYNFNPNGKNRTIYLDPMKGNRFL